MRRLSILISMFLVIIFNGYAFNVLGDSHSHHDGDEHQEVKSHQETESHQETTHSAAQHDIPSEDGMGMEMGK